MAASVEEVVEEVTEHVLADGPHIRGRFVVLVGVACLSAGVAIGYLVANRRLRKEYARISEQEIDQMRDHFRARLVAKEEKPDLSDLEAHAKKVVEVHRYDSPQPPAPPGEPNVVVLPEEIQRALDSEKDASEGWDYEVEKAGRMQGGTYVIHYDERGEAEFDEITLTYYAGDDVLCNEQTEIVDSQEDIVGTRNLDKFGHGSHDKNIVYVRNERLGLEIEVCRAEGTYAEDVHGFKHEDPPPRRKRSRRDE